MKSIKDLDILKHAGIKQVGNRTCEECGNDVPIYERNGERYSVCLNCDTSNLAKQQTDGYEPPKRRELRRKSKAIEYIPNELKEVTFNDYVPKKGKDKQGQMYTQTEALNYTLEILKGKHQSLLFQGNPGTGKSHLFRCAAREFEKQKTIIAERNWRGEEFEYEVYKIVLYAKIPELLKSIQNTYKGNSKLTEDIILDTLAEVDVLILDEIAGERSKNENGFESWSSDILYQILDHRQGKTNLYNLNYTAAEVIAKYGKVQGKRILGRMANKATVLNVIGPDHRMKGLV
ncbi:DNA replication protein DnaC [Oceanobacillus picturae]|uniref:DNA replication protein DnaC n=1 Tax=Oceanobacillus picturae TaxID=171693 RepID=W9B9E8_9BACI|nr:AAA family ATPase [Oceanobacillus picturae]CDO03125.1 DNA replication protein DnaC [Oceanobacillus picturae]